MFFFVALCALLAFRFLVPRALGPFATLVREGASFRVIDVNRDSAEELARLVQSQPENIFSCFGPFRWYSGEPFPTRRHYGANDMHGSLPIIENHPELARVLIEYFEQAGDHNTAADLRRAGTSEILWSGLTLNLLMMIAPCVFLSSLRWLSPRSHFRASRALARARCPTCRYDLSNSPRTPTTTRCPECGQDWPTPLLPAPTS